MKKTVNLTAKTAKAKNRVRELGQKLPQWDKTTWHVIAVFDSVRFSNECGPWFCVSPDGSDNDMRWVHETNDPNFVLANLNEV